MSTDEEKKPVGLSKEQYDVITNKIAVAMAKHEAVVAGWIAKSTRANEPRRTQEELEAEDRALFQPQPPRLGLGCPIPTKFLKDNAESSNKELRARLLPSKGLKAAKARDAEEKAASAKRGLRDQSSDDEGGRSALGRAKKQRTKAVAESRIGEAKSAKVPSTTTYPDATKFITDTKDSSKIEPGAAHNEDKMDIDTESNEAIPPPKLSKKQRKRMNQAANAALAEQSGGLVSRPKHANLSPAPIQNEETVNTHGENDLEGAVDGQATLEGNDAGKELKKVKKKQKNLQNQLKQQASVELSRAEAPINATQINARVDVDQDEQARLKARKEKDELKRQKKRDKKAKKRLERTASSQS